MSGSQSFPSRARALAPLRFVEQLVLTLVHLDPRLTLKAQRGRLIQLVSEFLPDWFPDDIGKAYRHVQDLHASGMIITHAFVRPMPNLAPPLLGDIDRVFDELTKALGYHEWTTVRKRRLHDRVVELLCVEVALWRPGHGTSAPP